MNKEILNLEKSLFKFQYMSDINYLDKVIDATYKEIGKSGKIITKKDVISELSNLKEDRNITIYNYEFNQIDNNIYLIHYITKNNEELIYRTSIWKKDNNIKIIFHQASTLNENISLKEY